MISVKPATQCTSADYNSPIHIDLLYFKEHYAWIKDFSRLFADLNKHNGQAFYCKRCLGHFRLESAFERHQQLCTREDYISTLHILPEPESTIKFVNWKYKTWAPFVIYADLESLLLPVDRRTGSTHLYQNHQPCAASALLCSTVPAMDKQFYLFTGENSVNQLLDQLIIWETTIVEYLKQNCRMKPLTRQQQEDHNNAVVCCICHRQNRPFDPDTPNDRKVADHDHVTGYYIGAAHDECNRKRRVVYDIPVFFHNFRGYDSHLIVTAMSNAQYRTRGIEVIGQNMERYMQVKWGTNLVFRDSFMFLTSSLESLVQSLRKTDEHKFTHLESLMTTRYPNADYKLLLRKGVFPYEYLSSFDKFNDHELPPRESFFSTLRGEECSQEDYDYAQRVWTAFGCRTFEDYLKLYLASDVCQLADVFQNFRSMCSGNYDLDPAYFVSAPQLAWNSMLKMQNLELELISDPEMYRMIQPNIRGGICHASGRYARANNKYMGALYRPNEPESFIMYIDATNLYGYAMSQELPFSDFEWLTEAQHREAEAALTSDDWLVTLRFLNSKARYFAELARAVDAVGPLDPPLRTDIKLDTAYIFEVDLEYPANIHDRDDDYPLAPELLEIKTEMLSEKQLRLRRLYYGDSEPFSRKLVCSLLPKKHYVVYSETLKFYLERGMKVTKLHRGMRFETRACLADYIKFNTDKRAAARLDECFRNLFKMMNNAPFGKTIENVAKRTAIKVLTDMEKARRLAEKPQCINFRLFKPDLVAVESRKVNQVINKPFQLGFAVLEHSKLHMYRTYATLKDWFGPRMRMLYTDTDSLILQFFTGDLYRELLDVPQVRRLFDFSEIPANHPSHLSSPDDPNKGQVGFFKDETKGNPIIEFVALKPKMYSFKVCECQEYGSNAEPRVWDKQVGKGIARATLKRTTHQQYLDMYQEREATKVTNRRIASKLHQVFRNITQCCIMWLHIFTYVYRCIRWKSKSGA